jgi:hypothetical protein
VAVVKNGDGRLFDGSKSVVPDSLLPFRSFGLRGGALRVAEDQLHSAVGHTKYKGAGMYMTGKNDDGTVYDWCGGFVQWCYQTAAQFFGMTNPFGGSQSTLASPQKAISWAMAHPLLATVIRYGGGNPMDADGKFYGTTGSRPERQDLIDLTFDARYNPTNVIEGDICLVRDGPGAAKDWLHVSMVYNVSGGDTFDTINGNPYIWIEKGLKFSDKVRGVYRYAFLHLSLPPVNWHYGL